MAKCTSFGVFVFCVFLLDLVTSDDRIFFNAESEKRWNTPPELTPEATKNENSDAPQPRFLPFSASFTLSAGSSNAHSSSVGAIKDGISLSHSQSSSSGSLGNVGSGISVSQSSSFSAGHSGMSASNANAFHSSHPIFVDKGKMNTNSFAFGQSSTSAYEDTFNNPSVNGASSNTGSFQGHHGRNPTWTNIGPNYEIGGVYGISNQRPILGSQKNHRNWHRGNTNTRPLRLNVDLDDSQFHQKHPEVVISDYQPSSHQNRGKFINNFHNKDHSSQSEFTRSTPSIWSRNPEPPSSIQISAASASSTNFRTSIPSGQKLPMEFIRSTTENSKKLRHDPVDHFFSEITDTFSDLFDYSK